MYNHLSELLPPEIKNIREFKEIMDSEHIELELIEKGQNRVLYENFIKTATEYGVKEYEAQFKIKADILNEDLEFRKSRLLSRKMDKIPFTYRYLKNKLESLFGKEGYKLELKNNIYILKIDIKTYNWKLFQEVIKNFRYILPSNMEIYSTLTSESIEDKIYFGSRLSNSYGDTKIPQKTVQDMKFKVKNNIVSVMTSDYSKIFLNSKTINDMNFIDNIYVSNTVISDYKRIEV